MDLEGPNKPDVGQQCLNLMMLVGAVLIGLYMLIRWIFYPPAPFVRYQVISNGKNGCTAEGWVAGKQGDFLARLMMHGRGGRTAIAGYAIIHKNATSTGLSTTVKTNVGTCWVARYHLLVDGHEVDSLNAQR